PVQCTPGNGSSVAPTHRYLCACTWVPMCMCTHVRVRPPAALHRPPQPLPGYELTAHPPCDEEDADRDEPHGEAIHPDLRGVAHAEPDRDAIGRAGHEDEEDPDEERRPEPCADGVVSGPLEQVVEGVVAAR